MQTEYLLHQSQSLTAELQSQQEELKKTNDRLEQQALNLQKSEALLKSKQDELRSANEQLQEKARQLSEQMHQVEFKNREIEQARAALEEKAEQLSLSSRYKSEFLANMSHELRTPLNSLLILARLLADNVGGNLTPKQVEFARTIHSSGAELLALINDILDLAKIESGTVTLNIAAERFDEMPDYVERTFRQMASDKGLEFVVAVERRAAAGDGDRRQAPAADPHQPAVERLQVHQQGPGRAAGRARRARAGASATRCSSAPTTVVAFSVIDTGIGIPANKQRLIFEAFQQADGTTSREYGGTGLGLSISRELARLLGGEIRVASTPGRGQHLHALPAARLPAGGGGAGLRARVAPRSSRAAPRPPRAAAGVDDGGRGGRAAGRPTSSPTRRCWWSTTTSATCSRSPARSSSTACACCTPKAARRASSCSSARATSTSC